MPTMCSGMAFFWHPQQTGGHLRRDERGWHLPRLPQITQCIPNERKTMPHLPTSCFIKRGQIHHHRCPVVATWLPFSHHLVTLVKANGGKSPVTSLLRPLQPQRFNFSRSVFFFVPEVMELKFY